MATRAGTIKRIHVNKHILRANAKDGTDLPAVTIQTSKGSFTARRVEIMGPSCVVQGKPLSCGATVWVETKSRLGVDS
jgi:hypothetical protein